MTPLLGPLAEWVASARLNAPDRDRLWMTVTDWASALVSGTGHPLAGPYLDALVPSGETGPVSAILCEGKLPLATAAMVNAAISHLWEVDDAHRASTSHPGITVIPAVLAVAEERGLDGAAVAAAIVAGYEAILRIGSHLGAGHYRVNHSTATAGTMGAAAGVARALGLDAERTLWAFGHAGTQAAGLWAFLDDGADAAKAFHAATAVRNGIAAARMAEAGIPGTKNIIEGPRGMRAAWGLTGCDDDWLLPGDEPMIHDVTIKGWPVCGQMHSALEAAVDVVRQAPELALSGAPVRVELPESALAIAGRKDPSTVAEAKFSTSFCIAAILAGRPPSFVGLTDDLMADRIVRDLAARIDVVANPEFTARFPKERPARVTVGDEGAAVRSERSFRKGDPESPWEAGEFLDRTRDVLQLGQMPQVSADALSQWSRDLVNDAPGWTARGLFDLAARGGGRRVA